MLSDNHPSPNTMKRLPLTPIPVEGPFPADAGNKSTVSTSYAPLPPSHSDDDYRPSLYQRRKSSVPALTLGKAPYNRRRSHIRRLSPTHNSPGVPASLTPIQPTFNSERRTSLPALHFLETVQNSVPLHIETHASRRGSISEDIYVGLRSFTFGAPPSQVGSDSDESDEDERLRRGRAKMRAIDDGTRRPSLPTNDRTPRPRSRQSFSSMAPSVAPSMSSSAHIVVGERQWDEHDEPDWDHVMMGDVTPTKASPPPATPSSGHTTESASTSSEFRRPSLPIPIPGLRRRSRSADELASDFDRMRGTTPTQLSTSTPLFRLTEGHLPEEVRDISSSPEENALDGFDLEFILSQPAATAEADRRLQQQASSGRLRYKFRSRAVNANAIPSRLEDTFTGHLGQYDPVYERRKREWSFRSELKTVLPPQPDAVGPPEEQEYWRCEWIGRFLVSKAFAEGSGQVFDPSNPIFNRVQFAHMPDPYNKGNKDGGPRAIVHRHSRARAFSICRAYELPKKIMIPAQAVLMGSKSVLREYTRTESTRSLNTHGLIDNEDSRPSNRPHQHQGPRSTTPQQSKPRPDKSQHQRSDRPHGQTATNSGIATTSETKRSSAVGPSHPIQQPSSHLRSQHHEVRPRKDSTGTIASSSPSTSRSGSSNSSPLGTYVVVEPSIPVPLWDLSMSASPRTSTTSHAEAFAMRDLDTREHTAHHHHRDGATIDAHPHAAPLPPPAVPHGQQKTFGFRRLKRAFGSSKQHQSKDAKEPVSPGTEDEDEPKTATQPKFDPPWLTVARRGEREQHERMIRTLNNSFESVGLIPPQDKKRHSKPRRKNKGEECAAFEDVHDNMCMLLPLWPGETPRSTRLQRLSRNSSSSVRHSASASISSNFGIKTTIPLQKRKFLLVYFTPFVESPTDGGFNGSNNKKRRRPQTAGDRPHQSHPPTGKHPTSFAVVARLLTYDDLRSSGVRLPEDGLAVTSSVEAATLSIPSSSVRTLSSQVIAQCYGPETGVELVQEGLERLGLMDHTAPRGVDVNGDPTAVKLSEIGRAVVEMVWCGCVALWTFVEST